MVGGQGESKHACLAVVRLRGTVNVRSEVADTLAMLRLHKPNHATIIPATPTYLGMLQKAKDYLTWGEVSEETLARLLERRGRLQGNKPLTLEYLKRLGFESFLSAAKALTSGKLTLKSFPGLKPVFRLHPPSKGFKKTVKKAYQEGGELGYRGEKINELLERMM
ncbi:MAG: 50S ribosomal protein L30 [Candidatus Hecatellales archaeon]|nr:MAG: 50S ribosomal protein L30 [Candidatus Hecatellales archaeon]